MARVAFLVDGFNLYHSLEEASLAMGGVGTKWLDLIALCETFLQPIGGGGKLESVFYFSAPANHVEQIKPGARAATGQVTGALTSRRRAHPRGLGDREYGESGRGFRIVLRRRRSRRCRRPSRAMGCRRIRFCRGPRVDGSGDGGARFRHVHGLPITRPVS